MEYPKNVIVFGGTGGIGSEIARELTANGSRVMICGRDEAKIESLRSELDQPGYLLDARDPEQVKEALDYTVSEFGPLDGLVHAVGSVLLKPAHRTSINEFEEVFATNLLSAFSALSFGVPHLQETQGSAVFFSTAAAGIGLANHEAIAAAKAGVEGMVRSASATYAPRKVRINAVAPGLVETGLTESITKNEASRKYSTGLHALGRLGQAKDIANGALWLLSKDQSWVTGQVLTIDGGLSGIKG